MRMPQYDKLCCAVYDDHDADKDRARNILISEIQQRKYNVVYWYLVLQTEIIIKFEIPAASSLAVLVTGNKNVYFETVTLNFHSRFNISKFN